MKSVFHWICWVLQAPVMPLFRALLISHGLPTSSLAFWVTFYGAILWCAFGIAAYCVFSFLYDLLGAL